MGEKGSFYLKLSEKQRYILDVKIAVALLEDQHKKGQFGEETMKKIRKDAEKMIANYKER